jgi:hypothetical protein
MNGEEERGNSTWSGIKDGAQRKTAGSQAEIYKKMKHWT